jgi:hypothetical protein
MPADGNVHGWLWFYFVNEQLLRYLNLRVPRDYDTVPLWLFWGLCLLWLMPWSAYLFHALANALPLRSASWRHALRTHMLSAQQKTSLMLALWAAFPLLFFSFSTRQEYYVLPALPALAILIAGWLALDNQQAEAQPSSEQVKKIRCANFRATAILLALGAIFAVATLVFLICAHAPARDADLAQLLAQNPADYALSMGHFLDLNAAALGLFRLPIALAAAALFLGPLCAFLLRKKKSAPSRNPRAGRGSLRLSPRRTPWFTNLRAGTQLRAARADYCAASPTAGPHRHPSGVRVRQHARLLSPPRRSAHPRGPQLEPLVRQLLP